MKFEQLTSPVVEPISLAEAKAHLRVDTTDDDDYISALIVAARTAIESDTRRALVARTLRARWDHGFPDVLELPRPPLIAVNAINYIATDGDEALLATDQYTVDIYAEPGRIVPAWGAYWPLTRAVPNAVMVTYEAGYDPGGSPQDAAAVPESLLHAIKLLVTHWYEQRAPVNVGNITSELPFSVRYLIGMHRVASL